MHKNENSTWRIRQIRYAFLANRPYLQSKIRYMLKLAYGVVPFIWIRVSSILPSIEILSKLLLSWKIRNIEPDLVSKFPVDGSKKLPLGFDRKVYLQLNPDVQHAGIDPAEHYSQYGQYEGRLYASPQKLHILPGYTLDPTKKVILVVSHNASRTDAPILALNIVQSLSARYNVVVLLLGGGALVEAFQSTGAGVILEPMIPSVHAPCPDHIISTLCAQYIFLFALVNTVESRKVLPVLVSHFVPIVSLLHEFDSNTPLLHVFKEVCGLSTETVFSTQLTLENFLSTSAASSYFSVQAMPPGKCIVPSEHISTAVLDAEQHRLNQYMRPETVGEQCKAAAIATFGREDYVARLETLALSAHHKTQQDKADMQEILNSGDFQSMFSTMPHLQDLSDVEAIKIYFRDWKTGRDPPKPFPGFHPGIYRMLHGVSNNRTDPFADYLRQGEPEGPWHFPVIRPLSDHMENDMNASKMMGKVALHLHVYYPDIFPELLQRLTLNTVRPDLFISVPDTAAQEEVRQALIGYTGTIADIQVMPNQGRDIGSLLTGFGKVLTENYDIVGHLHTKKSLHASDRGLILRWKNLLLENLLGGEKGGRMADSILTNMLHDPTISIVFPDDPYALGWGANQSIAAEQLASRLGLSTLPEALNFPAGTMFWMRTPLLKRFVDLDLRWEDYPSEPLPIDGSMLHALERLFGVVAASDPFRVAVTHVPGVGR